MEIRAGANAYQDSVHQRLAGLLILMALSACGSPSTQPPATPAPVRAFVEGPPEPVPSWCATAECMRKLAAEAEAGGSRDAAVGWLGAAYRLAPTDETFTRWLDALAQTGQHRRLAQALAEATAAGLHTEQLARYQGVALPHDAALQSGPATADVHDAMQAELEGRVDDAIAGLAGAKEPIDLAHRGDLLWARGDWDAAREAWTAARIAIDERGGSMRSSPVELWHTSDIFWVGDSLILIRSGDLVVHDEEYFGVTELQQWTVADPPRLLRSLTLPEWVREVQPSVDGRRLYAVTPSGIDVLDFVDGHRVAHLPLRIVGGGLEVNHDGTHVLAFVGQATELWSLAGERLDRFELEGTTPTPMRIYNGPDGHDHVMKDSPTWPVSMAMTDDLRWVAVGGSDSKVRIFDRQTGKQRVLELESSAANLNRPLDMRFVGDELVVIYKHGELIRWRVHDGTSVRQLVRACDDCEALYAELSDDASAVVTGGGYGSIAQVSDASTHQILATLHNPELITELFAFADDGRIAFANANGRPRIWPGSGDVLTSPWDGERPKSHPQSPSLSTDGRYLSWGDDASWIVWDLEQRRQLSPSLAEGDWLLAMAADGTRYAVDTDERFELRRWDGTVEHHDNPSIRVEWFASDGHLAVLRRYDRADQFIDLARGQVVDLRSYDEDGLAHAVDAAGTHVLRLTSNMIELFDAESGARLSARPTHTTEAIAIAPDASWFAWLELHEESDQPITVAHLLPVARGGRLRTLSVPDQATQLIASPGSDELLIVSERALTRWRLPTDERETIELGDIRANHIRYSADSQWLFFAEYNRVDIRANSSELAIAATVYPLLDGNWMVRSSSGAVDGNARAREQLATVVAGSIDNMVLGGGLAWDRFAVAGLLGFVLAGHDVHPPLPANPRP